MPWEVGKTGTKTSTEDSDGNPSSKREVILSELYNTLISPNNLEQDLRTLVALNDPEDGILAQTPDDFKRSGQLEDLIAYKKVLSELSVPDPKMGDKSTGEPFLGIEVAGATDYEGVLPSDTVSLSDSDSEDLTFADDPEVATISPEEKRGSKSDENGDFFRSEQKSPVQPFHLKGMSSSFSQRSQSIFDCLEGAAKRTVPSMAEDNVIDGRFKRPLPPPNISSKMPAESLGRSNKPPPSLKAPPSVPDYVTHPERWTKYSLDDVPESSEKTNRSTAMEFLEDLKKSKEEQTSPCPERYTPSFNQDASSSGAGRIIFTKPTKTSLCRSERKRPHAKEDQETKLNDTEQELKEKSPKKPSTQEEGENAAQNPPEGGTKEPEGWKQQKLEEPNVQKKAETDSSEESEGKGMTAEGFHGSKKRNRKQFRPKVSHEEDEEES